MIKKFLFFQIWIIIILFANVALGADKISGNACYTYGDNESLVQAEQMTKTLAIRNAIESYSTFIESTTKITDFQLSSDLINTVSAGQVKGVKVLKRLESGRKICYTVEGFVEPSELKSVIKDYLAGKDKRTDIQRQDNGYMLYCHKESGECFSPKKEADTTLEYFGNRNHQDYETVFINVKPARNLDKELSEKEKEELIEFNECYTSIMIKTYELKFFKQVEKYPSGAKKVEYTGYGTSKHTIAHKSGKFTEWYESGKKKMEVDNRYGVIDGKVIVWHEDGNKKEESEYVNDKLHGTSKLYDSRGTLRYKDTYKIGKKTNRKAYDREGKLTFDQDY